MLAEDADTADDGRGNRTVEAFRRGMMRIPRLFALHLLILSCVVSAGAVFTVFHFVIMLLLLSIIILGVILAITGLPLAYVVASAGPAHSSLGYTAELISGRFGAVMRRMLVLLALFAVLIVLSSQVSAGVAYKLAELNWAGQPWKVLFDQKVVSIPLSALSQLTAYVGTALLYKDLGGELDEGLENPEDLQSSEVAEV